MDSDKKKTSNDAIRDEHSADENLTPDQETDKGECSQSSEVIPIEEKKQENEDLYMIRLSIKCWSEYRRPSRKSI